MRQIDKKLTRDKVVAEMRRAILYGTFPANQELSQDKVAADLGVSKMPVREAIQVLAMEGLLTILPNRSPIVNELSEEYIRDHFEIRSMLEQEAVARAAQRDINADELRQTFEKEKQAIATEDFEAFNYFNGKIHQLIWNLSGNLKLEQILSQMWHTMHIDNFAKKNALRSNEEHRMIIEAIIKKDAAAARKAMERHVIHSYEKIIALKRSQMPS